MTHAGEKTKLTWWDTSLISLVAILCGWSCAWAALSLILSLFRRWPTPVAIQLHLLRLRTGWHWTHVQEPYIQLLHCHFYSLLISLGFFPGFGNGFWQLKLLHEICRPEADELKAWSDPRGWGEPSPSLTDKETFSDKETQFSEKAQNLHFGCYFSLISSPYYLSHKLISILMLC